MSRFDSPGAIRKTIVMRCGVDTACRTDPGAEGQHVFLIPQAGKKFDAFEDMNMMILAITS
jgi:hypothetical protein